MTRLLGLGTCVGILLLTAPIRAENKEPRKPPTADLIDFEVRVAPLDPFADSNKVGRPSASFQRGEALTLILRAVPRSGYHTYPFTQRSADPAQSESFLSTLTVDDTAGLKRLGPPRESEAEFVVEKAVGVYLEHAQPFTLSQDFFIPPDAAPGKKLLRFHIDLQVCNDKKCTPGTHTFEVPFTVAEGEALKPEEETQKRLDAADAKIAVVEVPADLKDQMSRGPEAAPPAPARGDASKPAQKA